MQFQTLSLLKLLSRISLSTQPSSSVLSLSSISCVLFSLTGVNGFLIRYEDSLFLKRDKSTLTATPEREKASDFEMKRTDSNRIILLDKDKERYLTYSAKKNKLVFSEEKSNLEFNIFVDQDDYLLLITDSKFYMKFNESDRTFGLLRGVTEKGSFTLVDKLSGDLIRIPKVATKLALDESDDGHEVVRYVKVNTPFKQIQLKKKYDNFTNHDLSHKQSENDSKTDDNKELKDNQPTELQQKSALKSNSEEKEVIDNENGLNDNYKVVIPINKLHRHRKKIPAKLNKHEHNDSSEDYYEIPYKHYIEDHHKHKDSISSEEMHEDIQEIKPHKHLVISKSYIEKDDSREKPHKHHKKKLLTDRKYTANKKVRKESSHDKSSEYHNESFSSEDKHLHHHINKRHEITDLY